ACAPRVSPLVSHVADAAGPAPRWSQGVVALSCRSTTRVGEPCPFAAPMLTVTTPLTDAPFAGLMIDAVSVDGGGVPPPHCGAPDAFTGLVASLLIVTAGETPQLPAASVASACTWYAPVASPPVAHSIVPLQL